MRRGESRDWRSVAAIPSSSATRTLLLLAAGRANLTHFCSFERSNAKQITKAHRAAQGGSVRSPTWRALRRPRSVDVPVPSTPDVPVPCTPAVRGRRCQKQERAADPVLCPVAISVQFSGKGWCFRLVLHAVCVCIAAPQGRAEFHFCTTNNTRINYILHFPSQ